ncbi:ABC1 family protein [Hibiscus syriacus]|uniref:ABC1 family protein n=1 Tax=Hibiscus syriacus TaxID=106335 RepID=A0A6A3BAW7_HIBSY|nr:ABC1 family protein [Hibiscus syriacus]
MNDNDIYVIEVRRVKNNVEQDRSVPLTEVTSTEECVVLEMKTWNLLLPIQIDQEKPVSLEEQKEKDTPYIISKELLSGPKSVLVPQASPNLRSISADSIEGRSALHQYFMLFRENYVEYAHKVCFELKHHGPQLKRIIDDQHARPVTQFFGTAIATSEKTARDQFAGVELDALKSSINTLKARLRRYTQSSKDSVANQRRKMPGRNYVQDTQISQLKSSLEKLSLLNSESTKKVELVESALKTRDSS